MEGFFLSRRWGFICACVVRHSCVFSLSANLRLPSRRFAARHPAFLADTRRTGCFSTPLRGAASLPMFHLPPGDVMSVLRGARACGARHPCRVFTRLPASESLLFEWPLRRRSGANSAAGPKGEGQDARSQESNQEKGHPDAAVSGLLPCDCAKRLRGLADSPSLDWQPTGSHPCEPPCGPFLRHFAAA